MGAARKKPAAITVWRTRIWPCLLQMWRSLRRTLATPHHEPPGGPPELLGLLGPLGFPSLSARDGQVNGKVSVRLPLSVADIGSGPPVLLVHGQPGMADDWQAVCELARVEHRLIVPDRPGYGRTGGDAVSICDNARLLADLLIEREAVPATVVGHSYGGTIAVLLAASRPELVRGLVLVGSVGPASSLGAVDRLLGSPGFGDVLSTAGFLTLGTILPRLRPVAARLLPGSAGDWVASTLPDARHATASEGKFAVDRQVVRAFVHEQRTLLEEIPQVEEAATRVRVPTVVIGGEWDVVVPLSSALWLHSTIEGSELVVVERAGHFVARDHPEVVVDALRRIDACRPPRDAVSG